jgi:hypothetical protein
VSTPQCVFEGGEDSVSGGELGWEGYG